MNVVREAVELTDLDFSQLLRAGDGIVCSQLSADPAALLGRLAAAQNLPPDVHLFVGANMSGALKGCNTLSMSSYGGLFRTEELVRQSKLEIVPIHYSRIADALNAGSIKSDVALIQVARHPVTGKLYWGVAHGYMLEACARARLVIAECNPHAPIMNGGELPEDIVIDYMVQSDLSIPVVQEQTPSEIEVRIAVHVAELVPDRSVLQVGVGTLPRAVLGEFRNHRDLGVHSGIITDGVMVLMEQGVVTNRYKSRDPGVTVTGALIGTAPLFAWANGNPALRLAPISYTHSASVIESIDNFFAINSALEVDLLGQANAEVAGGRHVGGFGGLVDFSRGAQRSRGGRAIVAMPAAAKGGTVSRIVDQLSGPTTITSADADVVITEWGVAHLRDRSYKERVRAMLAISDPAHREALTESARRKGWL